MGETNGSRRSIFHLRSTAAARLSWIPGRSSRTAWPVARILVVVMAVAALALANTAGTDLAEAQTSLATDRAALVALYNATDGPNWRDSTGWLSDLPLREWSGVTTDGDGRVTKLNLFRRQMSGPIPAELGNLSNLQELSLVGNQLTGEIPPEVGNLSNLGSLFLFSNQLSGEIPPELGGLSNLERLHLNGNELSGEIPPELGGLSNLQVLYLFRNELSGEIPPELSNLSNLQVLHLYHNRLTGEIPPELGDLSNLKELHLNVNQLTGEIPPELGNLSNLQWLHLYHNRLTGEIPPELGNLSNLQWLHLYHNRLTGEIPPELGSLSNLLQLYLFHNELSGEIPPELGNLSNLEELNLNDNELSGEIPPELGNLSNLEELNLNDNELSGEIPPELGNLSNLRELYLNDNPGLSGPLPASFVGLTLLLGLDLSNTGLCAPTDAEFQGWLRDIWIKTGVVNCTADQAGTVTLSTMRPVVGSRVTATLSDPDGDVSGMMWQWSRTMDRAVGWTGIDGATEASYTPAAGDEGHYLRATVRYTDSSGPGKTATAVSEQPVTTGDPLVARYDTNGNGAIDRSEVIAAIGDYLTGRGGITRADVIRLIGLYLNGPSTPPAARPIPEHPEERAALVALYSRLGGEDSDGKRQFRADFLNGWKSDPHGPYPVFDACISDFEDRWLKGTVNISEFIELYELLNLHIESIGGTETPECLAGNPPIMRARAILHSILDRSSQSEFRAILPWPNRDGWGSDETLDQWYGVEIDDMDGHVIELDLSANNLDGELGPELGGLTALKKLDLSGNLLDGGMGAWLGQLSSLERLDLSSNMLSGPIPSQLSEIESLADVNLSSNGLTGRIPWQLGRIIPSEGGNLKTLYLYDNSLEGCIPRSLLGLLTDDVHRAKEKLDVELRTGNLRDVISPVIFERAWEGWILPTYGLWLPPCPPPPPELPLAFGDESFSHETHQTDKLALMAIRKHFKSAGSDDSEFSDWSDNNLNLLGANEDCGVGAWHGVETEWQQHQGGCRVVELSLDKRELKGTIPKEVGYLTSLRKLNLSLNCLTGTIPAELGHLSNLKVLALNSQGSSYVGECVEVEQEGLQNELPPEIGNLGELTMVNLFENPGLTGELPPEFGNLANLEHLKLENTGFSGCVPPPLVQNFADPIVTKAVAPMLAFGAVTAFTGGTGITFTFLQKRLIGPIVSKVVGLVLDPVIKPGAEHWLPWVGSELHNVKLYCD